MKYDAERYEIVKLGGTSTVIGWLLLDLKNDREPWCPYSAYVGIFAKKFFAECRAASGKPTPLCGCKPEHGYQQASA